MENKHDCHVVVEDCRPVGDEAVEYFTGKPLNLPPLSSMKTAGITLTLKDVYIAGATEAARTMLRTKVGWSKPLVTPQKTLMAWTVCTMAFRTTHEPRGHCVRLTREDIPGALFVVDLRKMKCADETCFFHHLTEGKRVSATAQEVTDAAKLLVLCSKAYTQRLAAAEEAKSAAKRTAEKASLSAAAVNLLVQRLVATEEATSTAKRTAEKASLSSAAAAAATPVLKKQKTSAPDFDWVTPTHQPGLKAATEICAWHAHVFTGPPSKYHTTADIVEQLQKLGPHFELRVARLASLRYATTEDAQAKACELINDLSTIKPDTLSGMVYHYCIHRITKSRYDRLKTLFKDICVSGSKDDANLMAFLEACEKYNKVGYGEWYTQRYGDPVGSPHAEVDAKEAAAPAAAADEDLGGAQPPLPVEEFPPVDPYAAQRAIQSLTFQQSASAEEIKTLKARTKQLEETILATQKKLEASQTALAAHQSCIGEVAAMIATLKAPVAATTLLSAVAVDSLD